MINKDILEILDNDGKILYALYHEGPLRFKELLQLFNPYEILSNSPEKRYSSRTDEKKKRKTRKIYMSRATLSKRLKYLRDPKRGYIHLISTYDRTLERYVQRYELTPRGIAFIKNFIIGEDLPIQPDLFGMLYRPIIEFFQERGFDAEIHLTRIILMIGKLNPSQFFNIPQTDELFYTLFYIYQNMLEYSLNSDQILYFDLETFCETYSIRKIFIQYHLEKLLNANLGIYLIPWDHPLFFQKEDLIGVVLFNFISDALEYEIVRESLRIESEQSFPRMAEQIIIKLISLGIIHKRIETAMKRLIEALLVIKAIERGFTRPQIVNYWPPFLELLQEKEGIEISKLIFGTTTEYQKIQAILKILNKKDRE